MSIMISETNTNFLATRFLYNKRARSNNKRIHIKGFSKYDNIFEMTKNKTSLSNCHSKYTPIHQTGGD